MSMIAGITVLPARLTRRAPAGTGTSPPRPTCMMRVPSTTNAAFSIAVPSPTISGAPSNTVTRASPLAPCRCSCTRPRRERATQMPEARGGGRSSSGSWFRAPWWLVRQVSPMPDCCHVTDVLLPMTLQSSIPTVVPVRVRARSRRRRVTGCRSIDRRATHGGRGLPYVPRIISIVPRRSGHRVPADAVPQPRKRGRLPSRPNGFAERVGESSLRFAQHRAGHAVSCRRRRPRTVRDRLLNFQTARWPPRNAPRLPSTRAGGSRCRSTTGGAFGPTRAGSTAWKETQANTGGSTRA